MTAVTRGTALPKRKLLVEAQTANFHTATRDNDCFERRLSIKLF